MLANIEAESKFDSGALGDNNTSGGLFQHHEDRLLGLINYAGKDWHKNWKKQIDYALSEPITSDYLNTQFASPEAASEWFTLNWENPSDKVTKAKERKANIAKYNY